MKLQIASPGTNLREIFFRHFTRQELAKSKNQPLMVLAILKSMFFFLVDLQILTAGNIEIPSQKYCSGILFLSKKVASEHRNADDIRKFNLSLKFHLKQIGISSRASVHQQQG